MDFFPEFWENNKSKKLTFDQKLNSKIEDRPLFFLFSVFYMCLPWLDFSIKTQSKRKFYSRIPGEHSAVILSNRDSWMKLNKIWAVLHFINIIADPIRFMVISVSYLV